MGPIGLQDSQQFLDQQILSEILLVSDRIFFDKLTEKSKFSRAPENLWDVSGGVPGENPEAVGDIRFEGIFATAKLRVLDAKNWKLSPGPQAK